jgi:hypothetical protein
VKNQINLKIDFDFKSFVVFYEKELSVRRVLKKELPVCREAGRVLDEVRVRK